MSEREAQRLRYKEAHARIIGAAISSERPKTAVRPPDKPVKPIEPKPYGRTAIDVLRCVSDVSGLTWEQIVSPGRKAELVKARHVAAWFMRAIHHSGSSGKLSMPCIAHILGRLNHGTIHHGLCSIRGNRQAYEPLISQVEERLNWKS